MLVCDMQGSQVGGGEGGAGRGGGGNKTQNYLVPYFIHFYLTHFLFCISGLLTGTRREDLLRLQAAKPCPPQLGNAPSRLWAVCCPSSGCVEGGRACFWARTSTGERRSALAWLPREQLSSHNHRDHRTKGPSCSMKHLHRRPPNTCISFQQSLRGCLWEAAAGRRVPVEDTGGRP